MITAGDVERVAVDTGFRAPIVEKVLRLHGILGRLDRHETSRGAWVLKGGTALNLLHLDVPRLSVDIDVNYIGEGEVEPALAPLLTWSERESRFLDLITDTGEIAAEVLVDDRELQDRIRRQPMLNWKGQHVREQRGKR